MKATVSILALAAVFSFCANASAQTKDLYFPAKSGVVRVYASYNAAGEHVGYSRDSVASVSGNALDGSAELYRIANDTLSVRMPVYFKDGEVIIEEIAALKDAFAAEDPELGEMLNVDGESRGIPSEMSVGMKLPDYTVTIKIAMFNIKTACKNRKVVAREQLSLPAGTYDCFVVEETVTVSAFMTTEKETLKSWYAAGIGLVKQESYEKNKLTSYEELSEVRGL